MTTSFNKQKHEYLIDGKRATGVTTIIGVLAKPALINWAAKMAVEHVKANFKFTLDKGFPSFDVEHLENVLAEARTAHTKKKEAAGEHGTDTHALVENYVNACLELEGKPIDGGLEEIKDFVRWAVANVDHFLFSERQMYNRDLFIAGTADFAYIGKDGKRYMADLKTSSGIFGIDFWLQTAAYRMLAEADGDAPYDGCVVVRMGKKGPQDFEVVSMFDYETCKNAFLACLTIYRAQAALKGVSVKQ